MNNAPEERIRHAREASDRELGRYLNDPSPRVVLALFDNPHLGDGHVLRLLGRRDIPARVIEEVAVRKDWVGNVRIRLAIARNPRTPLTVALEQLKFLGLFDLVTITNDRNVQAILRHKVEAIVIERLPKQPLGIKKAVARKASGEVLFHLMERDLPEVIEICLSSPRLTEGHLYKILHRSTTAPSAVVQIARNAAWSSRYNVRLALMLNPHAPLTICAGFIPSLKIQDLKMLRGDSRVHPSLRIHVNQEIRVRRERMSGIELGEER